MKSKMNSNVRPLCVDLDGTLIHSDLLIEAVFALLKLNPLYVFLFPLWLAKGKAHLKQQIADRVDLDVTLLPYNELLLTHLRAEKAAGRSLILATASNVRYAEQVALYLGIFDQVLASDAQTNLSGTRKRDRLVAAFGERGFDYAANDGVEFPSRKVRSRHPGQCPVTDWQSGTGNHARRRDIHLTPSRFQSLPEGYTAAPVAKERFGLRAGSDGARVGQHHAAAPATWPFWRSACAHRASTSSTIYWILRPTGSTQPSAAVHLPQARFQSRTASS